MKIRSAVFAVVCAAVLCSCRPDDGIDTDFEDVDELCADDVRATGIDCYVGSDRVGCTLCRYNKV